MNWHPEWPSAWKYVFVQCLSKVVGTLTQKLCINLPVTVLMWNETCWNRAFFDKKSTLSSIIPYLPLFHHAMLGSTRREWRIQHGTGGQPCAKCPSPAQSVPIVLTMIVWGDLKRHDHYFCVACKKTLTSPPDAGLTEILKGTHFQGHSRRAPKATILKNTIEV